MNNQENFHFNLLRVSMIQLLSGVGFERANKQTLNTVTDLYIKFFSLLVKEVEKMVSIRDQQLSDDHNYSHNGSLLTLQDLSQALINLKIVKPYDTLDVYGENPYIADDAGMKKFKEWCGESTVLHESRLISRPDATQFMEEAVKSIEAVTRTDALNVKQDSGSLGLLKELQDDSAVPDDWIKVILKKQQLLLWKETRLSALTNDQSTPSSSHEQRLPTLPDSCITVPSISKQDYVSSKSNEAFPSTNENLSTELLPISHIQNRLDTIELSFENEELYEKMRKQHETNLADEKQRMKDLDDEKNEAAESNKKSNTTQTDPSNADGTYGNANETKNVSASQELLPYNGAAQPDMLLGLDQHPIEFEDFGDMDGAFQRRDSFTDHYDYDSNF
ncbi:hypothetical protein ACO0RG_003806 [Hanseniaspora osmophila]